MVAGEEPYVKRPQAHNGAISSFPCISTAPWNSRNWPFTHPVLARSAVWSLVSSSVATTISTFTSTTKRSGRSKSAKPRVKKWRWRRMVLWSIGLTNTGVIVLPRRLRLMLQLQATRQLPPHLRQRHPLLRLASMPVLALGVGKLTTALLMGHGKAWSSWPRRIRTF